MGKIIRVPEPVAYVIETKDNSEHITNEWVALVRSNPGYRLQRGAGLYTKKELDKLKEQNESLHIDSIHTQIKYLQHEVLTIVEAAFSDKEQRQAVKDLVKGAFNKRHNWLDEIVYGRGDGEEGTHDAHPQAVVDGEKSQITED